jgi:hypothetical protein
MPPWKGMTCKWVITIGTGRTELGFYLDQSAIPIVDITNVKPENWSTTMELVRN